MHATKRPLETWERAALQTLAQRKGKRTAERFAAALEAERLTRLARFLLQNGLLSASPLAGRPHAPASFRPQIEHRLYALFAD